jgi:hypothetical protein
LRNKKSIFLFIVFPVLVFGAFFIARHTSMPVYADDAQPTLYVSATHQEPPTPAETIMKAISLAYPNRVSPAEFRNDDWAFRIGERWFYYAGGRILPEEIMGRITEYRPLWFYDTYPAELPNWESTAAERLAMTQRMEETRRNRQQAAGQSQPARQPRRPEYLNEALWNIANRSEASSRQVQINFLGHSLTVHSGISRQMRQINEIILREAETNPDVRRWVTSLGTVAGWTWRNVGSTANRSLHSYGIAIDLLPRDLGGLATYWAWTSGYNSEWWNIPFDRRYHPPAEVVRVFESFGFVWAGKWLNWFDTMHFEYRPEILILGGIEIPNLQDIR